MAVSLSPREKRHNRVRLKVSGSPEKPRLSVHKSLNNIYAQLIDDISGHTLVAASSLEKEFSSKKMNTGNKKAAKEVGGLLAKKAAEKGIKKIVFDRSGYKYHGVIKELAEAARAAGLEF